MRYLHIHSVIYHFRSAHAPVKYNYYSCPSTRNRKNNDPARSASSIQPRWRVRACAKSVRKHSRGFIIVGYHTSLWMEKKMKKKVSNTFVLIFLKVAKWGASMLTCSTTPESAFLYIIIERLAPIIYHTLKQRKKDLIHSNEWEPDFKKFELINY